MSTSCLLKDYDLVEKDVRQLYDSRLRLAILDALGEGPMRLADLRREVDANAPNTSYKAKDLEEVGLIMRENGEYKLTDYGRAMRSRLAGTLRFATAYRKFDRFWQAHHLKGIPDELWADIGLLSNAELIENTQTEPNKVVDIVMRVLAECNGFKGVICCMSEDYFKMCMGVLERGHTINAIFASGLSDVFTKELRHYTDEAIKTGRFNVWFADGVDFAYIVTQDSMILSFFLAGKLDHFDWSWKMYGHDPDCVEWGNKMYEHYKKNSELTRLEDLL